MKITVEIQALRETINRMTEEIVAMQQRLQLECSEIERQRHNLWEAVHEIREDIKAMQVETGKEG